MSVILLKKLAKAKRNKMDTLASLSTGFTYLNKLLIEHKFHLFEIYKLCRSPGGHRSP